MLTLERPILWKQAAISVGTALLTILAAGVAYPADPTFRITIDQAIWQKFEFRYPATYVFSLPDGTENVTVCRRDAAGDTWTTLDVKTADDAPNGVECVRFDPQQRKAYVSVGYRTTPAIQLEFLGTSRVEFVEIARYYDGRKAAYSLSIDNWGCKSVAHPGAPWKGPADDESDNYQAAVHVCRSFHLPVSVAINSKMLGGDDVWQRMQTELDRRDFSWEPVVHARTHPCSVKAYSVNGYDPEILGCRDDILSRLRQIPFGQHIFTHILTCGYQDESIYQTDAGQFVFVRGYNGHDNPESVDYAPWNAKYRFYGVGGLSYKAYDAVFQSRTPAGRYYAADVQKLNDAFDQVYQSGKIIYAMWHPDRYRNSAIHDPRPGVDGEQGSTLLHHLAYVANRKDVWYVPNGWLYCYRYVAEHACVQKAAE
ncbi:MAG TPA: hypothetical protein PLF81_08590 [Candidatus Anammoximicrobium sp.]|nr:hypothetical protein [Candidatus Anammoximicrobium sp.]